MVAQVWNGPVFSGPLRAAGGAGAASSLLFEPEWRLGLFVRGVAPELLLAADLTEFYGGETLANARRVVVSQLKHSHRHPERTWTAARLAAPTTRGKGVIARLADLYLGVAAIGTRDDAVGRIEIRLVSNMRCAETLATALTAAKDWLVELPTEVVNG
jgi:hypothetical protein